MSETYDLKKISRRLQRYLDEDRFIHTQGVQYTAAALAMTYGCDLMKAQTAGLLHDCAKCIPAKKKLKLCEREGIPVTSYEKKNPFMLHAKLGAYLARNKYDIKDEEILQAITWHTTGKEMCIRDRDSGLCHFCSKRPGRKGASVSDQKNAG